MTPGKRPPNKNNDEEKSTKKRFAKKRPDLSGLSKMELRSIESACNGERITKGPAAYNTCLSEKFKRWEKSVKRPNLSANAGNISANKGDCHEQTAAVFGSTVYELAQGSCSLCNREPRL